MSWPKVVANPSTFPSALTPLGPPRKVGENEMAEADEVGTMYTMSYGLKLTDASAAAMASAMYFLCAAKERPRSQPYEVEACGIRNHWFTGWICNNRLSSEEVRNQVLAGARRLKYGCVASVAGASGKSTKSITARTVPMGRTECDGSGLPSAVPAGMSHFARAVAGGRGRSGGRARPGS